jgi:phage gpG-like protein
LLRFVAADDEQAAKRAYRERAENPPPRNRRQRRAAARPLARSAVPESVRLESGSGKANPFADLASAVEELERRGLSIDEYSPVIAEELVAKVLERFELESGHQQGAWQELSDETLKNRRASESPKMLRDTDVMFGSITPWSEGNVAEAFTNVPYAKYHVSHEPRTKIPLRDFFDIDREEVAQYGAELILNGLLEGGGAAP